MAVDVAAVHAAAVDAAAVDAAAGAGVGSHTRDREETVGRAVTTLSRNVIFVECNTCENSNLSIVELVYVPADRMAT